MNKQEYLLACLSEECAELQKVISKSLRFGVNDINPHNNIKNRVLMSNEFNDILAVASLLGEEGVVLQRDPDQINAKRLKVNSYMRYSRKTGNLD